MKTYKVEVTETLQRVIEIEANSSEEALAIVNNQYKNEDIVLDYSDFVEKSIDLQSDYLKTNQLIKLIKKNPSRVIEANIQYGALNATHFIIYKDNEIIDEDIDGVETTWLIDEFINEYSSNYWFVDYLLNDIKI